MFPVRMQKMLLMTFGTTLVFSDMSEGYSETSRSTKSARGHVPEGGPQPPFIRMLANIYEPKHKMAAVEGMLKSILELAEELPLDGSTTQCILLLCHI